MSKHDHLSEETLKKLKIEMSAERVLVVGLTSQPGDFYVSYNAHGFGLVELLGVSEWLKIKASEWLDKSPQSEITPKSSNKNIKPNEVN